MPAYEIPRLRFSATAAEAITRRRFLKPTTADTFSMAELGDAPIGASMNDPKQDETLEVATGIVIVEAGGTIVAGARATCGTNGVAISAGPGATVGCFLTGGDIGELVTVKMN